MLQYVRYDNPENPVKQVSKSFSGRKNSLKPPVFGFCDSLLFDLEEIRELRAFIRLVFGQ